MMISLPNLVINKFLFLSYFFFFFCFVCSMYVSMYIDEDRLWTARDSNQWIDSVK